MEWTHILVPMPYKNRTGRPSADRCDFCFKDNTLQRRGIDMWALITAVSGATVLGADWSSRETEQVTKQMEENTGEE
jgi:hypothetical protein